MQVCMALSTHYPLWETEPWFLDIAPVAGCSWWMQNRGCRSQKGGWRVRRGQGVHSQLSLLMGAGPMQKLNRPHTPSSGSAPAALVAQSPHLLQTLSPTAQLWTSSPCCLSCPLPHPTDTESQGGSCSTSDSQPGLRTPVSLGSIWAPV